LRTIVIVLMFSASLLAGDRPIPYGARLFIESMDNGLDGYIRAEISKKKLPVRLVMEKEQADLVVTGGSSERDRKWHEGWLTSTKDHAEGNISIVDPKAKTIVWSSEAGDRSMWKGNWSRGGQRKVAERLVNNMQDYIQKN
jgi:hypothetical protein